MILIILATISNFILFVIGKIGYVGIFLLMTLQSFNIPIPSEITIPFSGFLASGGALNFWLVVIFGTFGSLFGSFLSYKFAKLLVGNGLREKYKIIKFLISEQNLNIAGKWFDKYGSFSVFFGRMVPIVSTFISFPAGLSNMPIARFLSFSFLGSFIWCLILAGIGFYLGENWASIGTYFRKFDYLIIAVAVLVLATWTFRRLKK